MPNNTPTKVRDQYQLSSPAKYKAVPPSRSLSETFADVSSNELVCTIPLSNIECGSSNMQYATTSADSIADQAYNPKPKLDEKRGILARAEKTLFVLTLVLIFMNYVEFVSLVILDAVRPEHILFSVILVLCIPKATVNLFGSIAIKKNEAKSLVKFQICQIVSTLASFVCFMVFAVTIGRYAMLYFVSVILQSITVNRVLIIKRTKKRGGVVEGTYCG